MIRRTTIRLISLLLVANGVAGIVAVWVGWSMTAELLTTLRQTSASVAAQQARLVESVRGVAAAVDDSAQATVGVGRSSARARVAVTDATRTADDLAATFDRLAEGSRVTVLGVRPLEGMTQPFETNAEDFRRVSASLGEMSASLDDNAREMARVGDDLRDINSQLNVTATNIEALPSASLLAEGLTTLELGTRLFLALILLEATLSALTGLALVMTTVQAPPQPVDRLVVQAEHAEVISPPGPRAPSAPTPLPEGERGQAPSPSGRRLG
jgi:hypothetical protein